jgi:hypothetical protein
MTLHGHGASLRLTYLFWIVLAVVTAVRILVSPSAHSVFPLFAASATHWWADQPLYASYASMDTFRYPPTFAVALTPFSVLGLRLGGILWTWCGLAIYGMGFWRFACDVVEDPWTPARKSAFLVIGVLVALPGIWNGQSNTLAVGLVLMGASAQVRQRWWTASAFLAAAVWIKLTPLAPALLLCALEPKRLAPRFILALIVGALVPFLTRPPGIVLGQYADWIGHLAGSNGTRWPGFRDAWTLWTALVHPLQGQAEQSTVILPAAASAFRLLQLLTAGAALAWCLWLQYRGVGPRPLYCATVGMGMAWLMLFGPATEHPTYAFLAPALVWAVLQKAWPGGRWLSLSAFFLIAIMGWDYHARRLLGDRALLTAALPLGSLFLTLWLIGYAWTRRIQPNQEGFKIRAFSWRDFVRGAKRKRLSG